MPISEISTKCPKCGSMVHEKKLIGPGLFFNSFIIFLKLKHNYFNLISYIFVGTGLDIEMVATVLY